MLYRFKGMTAFEPIERGALYEFLKLYARKDGTLAEPLEAIREGYLKDSGEGWYDWVFSTFDNDRYDERIDQTGWLLDAYRMNPVVLWAHNHGIPAIGIADEVRSGDNLAGKIRFNEKEWDPFGWGIGERVKRGVLRAGSVGFRVHEIEFVDHKAHPEETCDLIFRKQELLEFSICNVPANPFALRKDSTKEMKETKTQGMTAPTSDSAITSGKKSMLGFLGVKMTGGAHGRNNASGA